MAQYKDYYNILGVDRDADEKDIKRAYRGLTRQFHPDVNPGEERAEEQMREINEAYGVLSDPEKRAEYDRLGLEVEGQYRGSGTGYTGWNTFSWGFGGSSYFDEVLREVFCAGGMGKSPFYRKPNTPPESQPVSRGKADTIPGERKKEKIELYIHKHFLLFMKAYLRVKRGEDYCLCIRPWNMGAGRDLDTPLWRIRRLGEEIVVEVSNALAGENTLSHELSINFKWMNIEGIMWRQMYGEKLEEYLKKLRELVESHDVLQEDRDLLLEINFLGREVVNELNLTVPPSVKRGDVEALLRNDQSYLDLDIYREGERLIGRKEDLALLALLVQNYEGRLPGGSYVLAITKKQGMRIERYYREQTAPLWLLKVENGRIRGIHESIYHPKHGEGEWAKSFISTMTKFAVKIARGGTASGLQETLIESGRIYGVTEINHIGIIKRGEGEFSRKVERYYIHDVVEGRSGVNISIVEGPRSWNPEDIFSCAGEGKLERLRFDPERWRNLYRYGRRPEVNY